MKLLILHRRLLLTAVLLALLATAAVAAKRPNPPVAVGDVRPVDLVICLDTSGSMEALLDAARARIWDIVNEFARMVPTPLLRVGLLTYGSSASTPADGWIVIHSDLTDDLDAIYAELMSLETSGSEEFVGRVLDTAVWEMSWSGDWDALRIIFVAGNESADQGVERADFRHAGRAAQEQDILINALYAGNREQAVVEKWPDVARHGHGTFSAIDVASGSLQIATPQDDALLELNARLNETYVPYGERGEAGRANQVAQDNNASRLGVQSCSSRIVSKGSALYQNASWDLVDATLQEDFDLAMVSIEDLPEEMRAMTDEERLRHVEKKRAARESIQSEIEKLSAQREAFLRAERARETQEAGLDDAIRDAIRDQARTKGFTCTDC